MNQGRRPAADGWVGASLSWWGTGLSEQRLSKVRTQDEGRGHEVVETSVQVTEANILMQQGLRKITSLHVTLVAYAQFPLRTKWHKACAMNFECLKIQENFIYTSTYLCWEFSQIVFEVCVKQLNKHYMIIWTLENEKLPS